MQVWRPHTFYSRYGDVFAYGCVIICALLCLFGYFPHQGTEPDARWRYNQKGSLHAG